MQVHFGSPMHSDSSPAPLVRGLAAPWYLLLFMPTGLATGFINVALSYQLAERGVSVAVIAGVVSLYLLPASLRFLIGPIMDVGLSSARWYLVCLGVGAACLGALGFTSLTAQNMPTLSVLALLSGIAFMGAVASGTAAMVLTTPVEGRGEVAGWTQAGNYGGIGAGGGVGLWLATHGAGQAGAALGLAFVCLLCGAPMLWLRPPRPTAIRISHQTAEFGRALWALITTRTGILTLLVVTMPTGLGAAISLMSTVAADWRASADLVALVMGGLSALISVAGCIIGGYVCKLIPSRTAYVLACLACAAIEVVLALAPHAPTAFTLLILLDAFVIGAAASAVMAVLYESLDSRATAAMSSVLLSLCSLPLVVMTTLVGWVQTQHGSSAMLLVEAAISTASIATYALLLRLWRPRSAQNLKEAFAK
jgi:MFS transporter, PAT family, beta-lactamase induction signal transducer AmpG